MPNPSNISAIRVCNKSLGKRLANFVPKCIAGREPINKLPSKTKSTLPNFFIKFTETVFKERGALVGFRVELTRCARPLELCKHRGHVDLPGAGRRDEPRCAEMARDDLPDAGR